MNLSLLQCRGGLAGTVVAISLLGESCLNAQVTGVFDAGGGIATAGEFRAASSLGVVIGDSSAGSFRNSSGGPVTQSSVKSLRVNAAPASIYQGATSQLSGMATMDDDSFSALSGSEIAWGTVAYPFESVTSNGVLTAVAHVYAIVSGVINGSYEGIWGNTSVNVRGPYADSGIPEAWFTQYFGPAPNPAAAPDNDATGTGQNNLFKYVAGLDPTNAASVFRLRIERVDGQPNQKNLVFSPRWPDRIYTPMYRTNLLSGTWQVLSATNVTDNGTERTVTDLNATESNKFYRIQISLP